MLCYFLLQCAEACWMLLLQSGKFMTLDQIVHDADFPDCCRLLTCKGLNSLDQVADVKGRTDVWLCHKADV